MNNNSDSGRPTNAVSIYTANDTMDEFPVLRAFQQYIDAEQNKSRKRMLMLSIFFCVLMTIVISVFMIMLRDANHRNQTLNDRLVDYAMKDRVQDKAAVVVQPPSDNSAILQLSQRMEEMNRKLIESEKRLLDAQKADKVEKDSAAAEEIAKAEKEKMIAKEKEIAHLKTLLEEQKAKLDAETKLRKEAELEAYRRKHYPTLYTPPSPEPPAKPAEKVAAPPQVTSKSQPQARAKPATEPKVEPPKAPKLMSADEISEENAINYFLEEEDAEATEEPTEIKTVKTYSIPVEVKGSSSKWRIPNL